MMEAMTDEQMFDLAFTPTDEILSRVRAVIGYRFGVSDEQIKVIIKAAAKSPVSEAEVAKAGL